MRNGGPDGDGGTGFAGKGWEVFLEGRELSAGARRVRDVEAALEVRRAYRVPREVCAETMSFISPRRLPGPILVPV